MQRLSDPCKQGYTLTCIRETYIYHYIYRHQMCTDILLLNTTIFSVLDERAH